MFMNQSLMELSSGISARILEGKFSKSSFRKAYRMSERIPSGGFLKTFSVINGFAMLRNTLTFHNVGNSIRVLKFTTAFKCT